MGTRLFAVLSVVLIVLGIAGSLYNWKYTVAEMSPAPGTYKTPEEADKFVRFDLEGYDIIQGNYWQKASDADLSGIFELSTQKFASSSAKLPSKDRAGVAKMLAAVLQGIPEADKAKTAQTILGAVLYNIAPVGRNQLLTTETHQELQNEVYNVHPTNNLYENLGVKEGASADEIKQAYDAKQKELVASSSPEAKEELKKVSYAKDVLSDTDAKNNYDQNKVEPTVFTHLVNPSTMYVYIASMSPATEAEFEDVIRKNVKDGVSSMILDLRSNIGGDLTTSLTFLGLFSGPNQYAYDFFHLGKYDAQRTLGLGAMAELKKIREIAILTDGMTQSTAEVITAAMKRLHLAYSVGSKTRGWGSIEGQFPMQAVIDPGGTNTILLVVDLTVRDDTQPIEGNGVLPDIDISQSDWKSQLSRHFFSSELIAAIKKQVSVPPQK